MTRTSSRPSTSPILRRRESRSRARSRAADSRRKSYSESAQANNRSQCAGLGLGRCQWKRAIASAQKAHKSGAAFLFLPPLVRRKHQSAEAAGFSLHAFDLRNRVVRRADDPVAPVASYGVLPMVCAAAHRNEPANAFA